MLTDFKKAGRSGVEIPRLLMWYTALRGKSGLDNLGQPWLNDYKGHVAPDYTAEVYDETSRGIRSMAS